MLAGCTTRSARTKVPRYSPCLIAAIVLSWSAVPVESHRAHDPTTIRSPYGQNTCICASYAAVMTSTRAFCTVLVYRYRTPPTIAQTRAIARALHPRRSQHAPVRGGAQRHSAHAPGEPRTARYTTPTGIRASSPVLFRTTIASEYAPILTRRTTYSVRVVCGRVVIPITHPHRTTQRSAAHAA